MATQTINEKNRDVRLSDSTFDDILSSAEFQDFKEDYYEEYNLQASKTEGSVQSRLEKFQDFEAESNEIPVFDQDWLKMAQPNFDLPGSDQDQQQRSQDTSPALEDNFFWLMPTDQETGLLTVNVHGTSNSILSDIDQIQQQQSQDANPALGENFSSTIPTDQNMDFLGTQVHNTSNSILSETELNNFPDFDWPEMSEPGFGLPELNQDYQQQSQGTNLALCDISLPTMPTEQNAEFSSMQTTQAEQQQETMMMAARRQQAQDMDCMRMQGQQHTLYQQPVQYQPSGVAIESDETLNAEYDAAMYAVYGTQTPFQGTSGMDSNADLEMTDVLQQPQVGGQARNSWSQPLRQAMTETIGHQVQHQTNAGQVGPALPAKPAKPINPAPALPTTTTTRARARADRRKARESKDTLWLETWHKNDAGKPLKNESRPGMPTGYKAARYAKKGQRCRAENCNQTRELCQCQEFVK